VHKKHIAHHIFLDRTITAAITVPQHCCAGLDKRTLASLDVIFVINVSTSEGYAFLARPRQRIRACTPNFRTFYRCPPCRYQCLWQDERQRLLSPSAFQHLQHKLARSSKQQPISTMQARSSNTHLHVAWVSNMIFRVSMCTFRATSAHKTWSRSRQVANFN
jgi:hypothetical protein